MPSKASNVPFRGNVVGQADLPADVAWLEASEAFQTPSGDQQTDGHSSLHLGSGATFLDWLPAAQGAVLPGSKEHPFGLLPPSLGFNPCILISRSGTLLLEKGPDSPSGTSDPHSSMPEAPGLWDGDTAAAHATTNSQPVEAVPSPHPEPQRAQQAPMQPYSMHSTGPEPSEEAAAALFDAGTLMESQGQLHAAARLGRQRLTRPLKPPALRQPPPMHRRQDQQQQQAAPMPAPLSQQHQRPQPLSSAGAPAPMALSPPPAQLAAVHGAAAAAHPPPLQLQHMHQPHAHQRGRDARARSSVRAGGSYDALSQQLFGARSLEHLEALLEQHLPTMQAHQLSSACYQLVTLVARACCGSSSSSGCSIVAPWRPEPVHLQPTVLQIVTQAQAHFAQRGGKGLELRSQHNQRNQQQQQHQLYHSAGSSSFHSSMSPRGGAGHSAGSGRWQDSRGTLAVARQLLTRILFRAEELATLVDANNRIQVATAAVSREGPSADAQPASALLAAAWACAHLLPPQKDGPALRTRASRGSEAAVGYSSGEDADAAEEAEEEAEESEALEALQRSARDLRRRLAGAAHHLDPHERLWALWACIKPGSEAGPAAARSAFGADASGDGEAASGPSALQQLSSRELVSVMFCCGRCATDGNCRGRDGEEVAAVARQALQCLAARVQAAESQAAAAGAAAGHYQQQQRQPSQTRQPAGSRPSALRTADVTCALQRATTLGLVWPGAPSPEALTLLHHVAGRVDELNLREITGLLALLQTWRGGHEAVHVRAGSGPGPSASSSGGSSSARQSPAFKWQADALEQLQKALLCRMAAMSPETAASVLSGWQRGVRPSARPRAPAPAPPSTQPLLVHPHWSRTEVWHMLGQRQLQHELAAGFAPVVASSSASMQKQAAAPQHRHAGAGAAARPTRTTVERSWMVCARRTLARPQRRLVLQRAQRQHRARQGLAKQPWDLMASPALQRCTSGDLLEVLALLGGQGAGMAPKPATVRWLLNALALKWLQTAGGVPQDDVRALLRVLPYLGWRPRHCVGIFIKAWRPLLPRRDRPQSRRPATRPAASPLSDGALSGMALVLGRLMSHNPDHGHMPWLAVRRFWRLLLGLATQRLQEQPLDLLPPRVLAARALVAAASREQGLALPAPPLSAATLVRLVWASARLGHRDADFLDLACSRVGPVLGRLPPGAVAAFAWGLAQPRYADPRVVWTLAGLLMDWVAEERHACDWGAACHVGWALVRLRCPSLKPIGHLCEALRTRLLPRRRAWLQPGDAGGAALQPVVKLRPLMGLVWELECARLLQGQRMAPGLVSAVAAYVAAHRLGADQDGGLPPQALLRLLFLLAKARAPDGGFLSQLCGLLERRPTWLLWQPCDAQLVLSSYAWLGWDWQAEGAVYARVRVEERMQQLAMVSMLRREAAASLRPNCGSKWLGVVQHAQ